MDAESSQKFVSDAMGMETLRQTLGHPLNQFSSVDCIVGSVHGMDAASASERLLVASHLWAQGISAEYLPQSGVMISLLKQSTKLQSLDPFASVSTS